MTKPRDSVRIQRPPCVLRRNLGVLRAQLLAPPLGFPLVPDNALHERLRDGRQIKLVC